MNTDDMLKNSALKKAAVTFAAGYAKRMMGEPVSWLEKIKP
jgi:hypothetical protein